MVVILALGDPVSAIERPAALDEEGNNEQAAGRPPVGEPGREEQADPPAPDAEPDNRGAWLGVLSEPAGETLGAHLGFEKGVVLSYIAKGSPAEKAGLAQHDIITEVDGRVVGNQDDLREAILACQPGDEVTLALVNRGRKLERKVWLEERPEDLPRLPFPDRDRLEPPFRIPGVGEKLPEGFEPWEDVERWLPQGEELRNRLDQQMKELEKQLGEIEHGGRLELDLDFEDMLEEGKGIKGLNFNFKAASSLELVDEQGSIEMRIEDGGKEVEVRDPDGRLLFEGPWDTEQDKAAAPPDIRERIEKLNDGNRFQFRLKNMPEPEVELPQEELD